MSSNFSLWNDTSVAHLIHDLCNKKKESLNGNPLSLEEFNKNYKLLNEYIEWKKTQPKKKSFSLYDFSIENLTTFLHFINDYTDNKKDELREILDTLIP
jgi:hypothetical protein